MGIKILKKKRYKQQVVGEPCTSCLDNLLKKFVFFFFTDYFRGDSILSISNGLPPQNVFMF